MVVKKVLILGSGFGGSYALRHLLSALKESDSLEVAMISDENFFLFSPLLHEVATGSVAGRHVAYPIRRLRSREKFKFVHSNVERLDLTGRQIHTTAGIFNFDFLIISLGGVTDMPQFDTPGEGGTNVFTLRTLSDGIAIRNHIIGVFEKASNDPRPEVQKQLLTFVVSGAGYIGVEVMAGLMDFIFGHLTRLYKEIDRNNIRTVLVEAEPKILAHMHPKLAAYADRHLRQMGVEAKLGSQITGVYRDHVQINNSEIVPCNTLIWVTGIVANPCVAELDIKKDHVGRVHVNEYLEVPGWQGVYAVGDCAHFSDRQSGGAIPPRAHTTVRQAKVAAHNILAEVRGTDKKKYRYSNPFEMASLGSHKAAFRFSGFRIYGFLAHFVWLVGYSLLVTGVYNRTRIILDWLLSLIFGRDTTFLKNSR